VSDDPQTTPELQAHRSWRRWPWGLIALGLALLSFWGIVLIVGMLIGSGMCLPSGDDPCVDAMPHLIAVWVAEVLTISGGFIAAVLAWRWNRGRVTASLALILLSLWVGVLLHDPLSLMNAQMHAWGWSWAL
jgi:hypothetical protein